MPSFQKIYDIAAARKGGPEAMEATLPINKSAPELAQTSDDRFLAEMTRRVFCAGFVWRVIDKKWPDFERVFHNFQPGLLAYWPDEVLENLARDKSIVRNLQKVSTVRDNAAFVLEISREHGSFGEFIALWPSTEIVELWWVLKKRGSRLGGMSAQYFLRRVGKDTFILTQDVVATLRNHGFIDITSINSLRTLRATQVVFNELQEESGRSMAHISRILSYALE